MKNFWKKLENLMVAITFAEAGESETAKEVLKREQYAENAHNKIRHTYSPPHAKRGPFDILP